MRKYYLFFVILFSLLFFVSQSSAKEDIEDNNLQYNIEQINTFEVNQDNSNNTDLKNYENIDNTIDENYEISKSLSNEEDTPFKEVVEGSINKNLSAIEGKIEENAILSLDECIKKALSNNPKIKSASNNSEIYKTKILQAWSNYFPTFNMTNGITRNRYFTINFTVEDKLYTFYNTIDITASQLLFDFGKTKTMADMAKFNWESTVANLDETINQIIFDVTSSYYNLLYAKEKKKVYEDTVNNYMVQLKQTELFYATGKKAKIDVITAEYNLGNAKLGLTQTENEIELAQAELNEAMGLPEYKQYTILDNFEVKPFDYTFENLFNAALEYRPELKMYQKQIKASEMLVRSARRAYYPNIEAFGEFQDGGGTSLSDDYGWTIGAQFRYTNINFLLMKKELDEAKATLKKDIADLEVRKNKLYLEVKQAYIKLKNAQSSVPITGLSLSQAQEQYKLAQGRYKAGIGDIIEIKDAENTYKNARLDYLYSILQYNLAVAEIERVIGIKLKESTTNNDNTEVIEIIE